MLESKVIGVVVEIYNDSKIIGKEFISIQEPAQSKKTTKLSLTQDQITKDCILELRNRGHTIAQIANDIECSESTLYRILKKRKPTRKQSYKKQSKNSIRLKKPSQ